MNGGTGVVFDLSINLSMVFAVGAALITFVTAFNKLSSKIELNTIAMESKFSVTHVRLAAVEDTLKDVKAVNERMAVIEVRQNTQSQQIASCNVDIHDLRTGKGWIADPKAH